VVPAPAMDPLEKKLTYVELGQFENKTGVTSGYGANQSERFGLKWKIKKFET